MLQGDLDVLVDRAEFIIFMQSRVPLGPGKFHVVVLVSLTLKQRARHLCRMSKLKTKVFHRFCMRVKNCKVFLPFHD